MVSMFRSASLFNQNISSWVVNISGPSVFNTNANPAWVNTPSYQPDWQP